MSRLTKKVCSCCSITKHRKGRRFYEPVAIATEAGTSAQFIVDNNHCQVAGQTAAEILNAECQLNPDTATHLHIAATGLANKSKPMKSSVSSSLTWTLPEF